LQYSTLAGYRAALASAFKHHTDLDVSHDPYISDLLKSFKRERPPARNSKPQWDIVFILFSLMRNPFRDVRNPQKVSLLHLTWKTVFLILLASGSRRGEIHAIKFKGVKFGPNDEYVTLTPSPDFMPKSGMLRPDALKSIKIYSLRSTMKGLEEDDYSLCPVESLKAYMNRTCQLRSPTKQLLFISVLDGFNKDVRKNTVSGWIKNLILYCYQNPSPFACELTGTRTHDIRGFAHSFIFRGTVAMEDLMQSGSWKSHSTFTKNYLKDLTELDSEQLLRLGPIVAAQKIVVHSSV